jgi:hypothetical protein
LEAVVDLLANAIGQAGDFAFSGGHGKLKIGGLTGGHRENRGRRQGSEVREAGWARRREPVGLEASRMPSTAAEALADGAPPQGVKLTGFFLRRVHVAFMLVCVSWRVRL